MGFRTGILLAALLAFCSAAASADVRPLRLFFSSLGLSNPNDVQSPAVAPTDVLGPAGGEGANPEFSLLPGETRRLYIWAQIMGVDGAPPGTPNNASWNGISLRTRLYGAGGSVGGFGFWNYANGAYTRWQLEPMNTPISPTEVEMKAIRVTSGASVNNANASQAVDAQQFRTVNAVRQDVTLLGAIDVVAPPTPGTFPLKFAVGPLGIARSGGGGAEPVYFGFGDEGDAPLGNAFLQESPEPEALIHVIPEPAAACLLIWATLLLRRRMR